MPFKSEKQRRWMLRSGLGSMVLNPEAKRRKAHEDYTSSISISIHPYPNFC